MPAPSSWLSTDHILYEALYKPIASSVCFIDPNHITVACFLMLVPILWGLVHRWPLWIMIAIMFVRQSLDCMDGAVARTCDKKSKLGAVLDLTEDTLTIAALGGFVVWTLWNKRSIPAWWSWVAALIWIYALVIYSQHVVGAVNDKPVTMNAIEQVIHDNTVVLSVLFIVAVYKLMQLR